jgi:hypothetical protein
MSGVHTNTTNQKIKPCSRKSSSQRLSSQLSQPRYLPSHSTPRSAPAISYRLHKRRLTTAAMTPTRRRLQLRNAPRKCRMKPKVMLASLKAFRRVSIRASSIKRCRTLVASCTMSNQRRPRKHLWPSCFSEYILFVGAVADLVGN